MGRAERELRLAEQEAALVPVYSKNVMNCIGVYYDFDRKGKKKLLFASEGYDTKPSCHLGLFFIYFQRKEQSAAEGRT